jgi:ABC-type antimicrobial peptide transport system permease subunit
MAQFTTEAVTFTLLGLAVGLVAGIIAASPVTLALVSNSGASSRPPAPACPARPARFSAT